MPASSPSPAVAPPPTAGTVRRAAVATPPDTAAVAVPVRRVAVPPESHYEDDGCEVAASCLACPLPRCKYDDMRWYERNRRLANDLRITAVIEREGLSAEEAAARFAITKRTVFRVLRRSRQAMRELTADEAEVFAAMASASVSAS